MRYRNIFVLCTGRCGSTTFTRAAEHIQNYSAAHESRSALLGHGRFAYPSFHIEADNRLSWLLGRLENHYGNEAFYVHLQRDLLDTARSFLKRHDRGILQVYRTQILMGASSALSKDDDMLPFCIDYCQTVDANIASFLKDKPHKMNFRLEAATPDWENFWTRIDAEGDIDQAASEWNTKYNASKIFSE